MKTIKFLFGAAVVATMVASCGQGAVELNNRVDSLNYAFGAANGDGIRQYVIGADTADAGQLADFVEGFSEAFSEKTPEKRIEIEAARFALTLMNDMKGDILFGDSTISFNEDIFLENLEKAMMNDASIMSSEQGMAYVQTALYVPMDSGMVRSAGQVDSINVAYAVVNGAGIRRHILGADTAASDVKAFMKYLAVGRNKGLEKKMYFEGMRIGMTMYGQVTMSENLMNDPELPANLDIIQAGVKNAITRENLLMSGVESMNYFNAYIEGKSAKDGEQEKEKGLAFLEENKAKDGVVVTESGLQYTVNVMGKGAKPTAESTVKVHYEGRLIDGTVFDSSIERGEPISFPLNGVIRGWTEGLQLMPIGSKFTFYIPYDLAYGENGAGQDIPPFAALIFDVELLDIEK